MLTAGALALAVIAPAVDPAEHAAEAFQAPQALPAHPEPAVFGPRLVPPAGNQLDGLAVHGFPGGIDSSGGFDESLYQRRQTASERATRAMIRRSTAVRPVPVTPLRVRPVTAQPLRRPAAEQQRPASERQRPASERQRPVARAARESHQRPAARETQQRPERTVRREAAQRYRAPQRRVVAQRRTTVSHRGMVRKTVRRTVERPLRATRGGMNAVIAYARSQVGKRYVHGGEGSRGGFDCSGLTRQAYARAGMRLPHSSGAQASRARRVPRGQARPGDLVIGPGHVGIYMGRGMMIDAGNRRTGVSYRKVYRGLRVARIPGS